MNLLNTVRFPAPLRGAVLALLPVVLATTAEARVWHVYPDGSGDAPTIAAAIDSTESGDQVRLHEGDYHEHGLNLKAGTSLVGVSAADVVIHGDGGSILSAESSFALQSVTVSNVTLRDGELGIHGSWPCRVRLLDCVIRECDVGVAMVGGELEIRDCEISDGARGVIMSSTIGAAGSVLMSRTSIHHMTRYGAAFAYHFAIDHVTFDQIYGDSAARGLWIGEGASGTIDECSFLVCKVGYYGGQGSAEMTDCYFGRGINAEIRGGGIVTDEGHDLTVSRTTFRGTRGAGWIGAGSTASFHDCDFVDNEAPAGGALAVGGDVTVTFSRFRGNVATQRGGALSLGTAGAHALVTRCTFVGDRAPQGACIAVGPGTVELVRSLIADAEGDEAIYAADVSSVQSECSNVYGGGPGWVLTRLLDDSLFSADPLLCSPDGFLIADASPCAPANSPCGEWVGFGGVGCSASGVFVDSQPGGLEVIGDGEARWASAFFDWGVGETHEISAPESLATDFGVLYLFRDWDDGGDRVHDVTVSSAGTIATARFDPWYELTMEWEGAGTVTPGSGFHDPDGPVTIEAIPDSGWAFQAWWGEGQGSYDGIEPRVDITMLEPLRQHAIFVPGVPVTIHSVPEGRTVLVGGREYVTPATVQWAQNTQMPVDADSPQEFAPGRRYRFASWSDGGDGYHFVLVGTSPLELTVEYALEYELSFAPEESATITPGDGWHAPGAIVPIEATADYEWAFAAWVGAGEGSYSGLENPAQVTMDGPVQQDAVIVEAFAGHGYEFTISASGTDPFETSAPPAGGVRILYLWGTCLQRGISAFEAQVEGTLPLAGFFTAPGVLNAGTSDHLFLAVGGCPIGDDANVLLGRWVIPDDAGGTLCLSDPDGGQIATADCAPLEPVVWPDPGVTGFASDGSTPCAVGSNGCLEDPVPVELSGLRAEAIDGTVIVSWQTAFELNHDGFHVYRASLGEADPVRRTETLLRGRSPYAWVDRAVEADHTYRYWVGAIDRAGREQRFGPVEVTTPQPLPSVTTFAGPRPTPFRGRTKLAFALAAEARVELTIFDVAGRVVRRYADLYRAGEHAIEWDARGTDGSPVPGGVYFASFRAGEVRETRKLVLLPGR